MESVANIIRANVVIERNRGDEVVSAESIWRAGSRVHVIFLVHC